MIMTKKIYAFIMKKMVKVKKPAGFFENPARGFSPTFSNGGQETSLFDLNYCRK